MFYEKPFVKFERLLETYLAFAPKGFISFAKAMPVWIKGQTFQNQLSLKNLNLTLDEDVDWRERYCFLSITYPMQRVPITHLRLIVLQCLTLDGVGEWTTTSLADW